ncbi:MAG: hypothetical protein RJA36_1565 [Pseudomonadota bacterium]|jgi:hypothetical protein
MNPNTTQLLEQNLKALVGDLKASGPELAAFLAQQTAHLSLASAEVGFAEALEAETDRAWLFTAGRAVRVADASDQRAWGLLMGFLLAASS